MNKKLENFRILTKLFVQNYEWKLTSHSEDGAKVSHTYTHIHSCTHSGHMFLHML